MNMREMSMAYGRAILLTLHLSMCCIM